MRRFFFLTSLGIFLLFFTATTTLAIYERQFTNKIYPGITVDNIDLSVKTKAQVVALFESKNQSLRNVSFSFISDEKIATASAVDIALGYNAKLIADQAFSIGRSGNVFADGFNKSRAWIYGLVLPPSYSLNWEALAKTLAPIANDVTIIPVDALFEIQEGKVAAFRPSVDGQAIDMTAVEEEILSHVPDMLTNTNAVFEINVPVKTIRPVVSLEDINTLGIKEHIGHGASRFTGSIPNRIHNISLAASRMDGTIISPGETFSFNDALGDVSKFTGYKEAYIIKEGKTILGDGGGVCQVSTTLFRAVLRAGLPIVERHPHAYRVSYYEQDSPPGLDATVYAPSYDLKVKNDTPASILIEAYVDTTNTTLMFDLYGTSDGRESELTKPVITNQTPPPEDRYQDDPTLPIGVTKQVDFKATGAKVTFLQTVKRGEEVLFSDTFVSNYRPWQAVFLRGTKGQ